jgi:DNA topoisomerase-3
MREKGLGTPATRASIIEGLIYEQYLLRNQRELQATAKAFSLMELLNGLGVAELTKPELTGDWEFQLRQIQRKQKSREEFMSGIAEMTRRIVDRAKKYEHDTIPGDFGVLRIPCPKCGKEVHERYKAFQCVNCDFSIWKTLCSRMFEIVEVEKLIVEKQVGPLQGFRSRAGKPFAAVLKLNGEFKVEFDFGQEKQNEDGEAAAPVDFSGKEPLGKCPKCGGRVFDTGMNYVCENAVGPNKTCTFRSGKIILQQEIDPAQLSKLLTENKTDLLKGFISKKTGRKFEAFLSVKNGDVGFEFPPRVRKSKPKDGAPKEPPVKIDFTGLTAIGACPKCGGKVFDTEANYLCERSQADKKPCKFKLSKTILQRPIEREQAQKILKDRKTDLIENFTSKAGKPFSAYLVMDDSGKVTFEFPPREGETADG